jgi:hypothetical protein
MKICTATLESTTPYSQSRYFTEEEVPHRPKELHDDYEKRTWRHKAHVDSKGFIEIPPTAFSNAVKTAAARLSMRVPGKGQSTYTKHFISGVLVGAPMTLPIKATDVPFDAIFCHADGKRGSGRRVMRYFPRIDEWKGDVTFHIFDDIITPEVFAHVLAQSGLLVGIGRFRPENGGFYGRYAVGNVRWSDQ